jgi:hypothetical protein
MDNVFDSGSINSNEAKLDQVVQVQRMSDQVLEEQIRALIASGGGKAKNQLMKLLYEQRHYLAGSLSHLSCFDDAWGDTFDYFFDNLSQVTTRQKGKLAFCETDEPLVFVIRAYLKRRITDAEMERKGYRRKTIKSPDTSKSSKQWVKQSSLDASVCGDGSKTLGDLIPAVDSEIQDHEQLYKLIELGETSKLLKETKMLTYSHVNCQVVARLCLQYLEKNPDKSRVKIKTIAEQLGLKDKESISAFRSFWSRSYWPLMKKICAEFRDITTTLSEN